MPNNRMPVRLETIRLGVDIGGIWISLAVTPPPKTPIRSRTIPPIAIIADTPISHHLHTLLKAHTQANVSITCPPCQAIRDGLNGTIAGKFRAAYQPPKAGQVNAWLGTGSSRKILDFRPLVTFASYLAKAKNTATDVETLSYEDVYGINQNSLPFDSGVQPTVPVFSTRTFHRRYP